MFGGRRTNARCCGSQPVGNIIHSFGESGSRTVPPALRPAPPHSLGAEGGTATLHLSVEKVPSCRKEASTAPPDQADPGGTPRRPAQSALSAGDGLAGVGHHHGDEGASSCALSVLARPLGAPGTAWLGGEYAGQGYAFWASSVETFYFREQKLEDAHRYWGRAACFRFHYVTPGEGDMVADDRARAF